MAGLKRRTGNAESVPVTMRYAPTTYQHIRKYAYEHNMTLARANEELVLKGLGKTERKAS